MSRRGWLLFAAMGVIWGLPYLLIRIAVRDLSPGTLVFLRTASAALLLLPLAASRSAIGPVLAKWRIIVVFSAVEVGVPWLLLSSAEEHLSSSVSGLLIASVPLIGALLAVVMGTEHRLPARGLGGLLVGLAGVGVLVGINVAGSDLAGVGEILLCAFGYALGPAIISRYLSDVPALGVVALSFALCSVVYAPYALTHLPRHMTPEVWSSVALLGLVCTTLAFVLFFSLIEEVGPVKSTVVTYFNPAVAVLLGITLLHEPFSLGLAIGFPLILAGSFLTTRRPRPVAQPRALEDASAARAPAELVPDP